MNEEQLATVSNTHAELWIASGHDAYLRWAEFPFAQLQVVLERIAVSLTYEDSFLIVRNGTCQLYLHTILPISAEDKLIA